MAFPEDSACRCATASHQIGGGAFEDSKGLSICVCSPMTRVIGEHTGCRLP